MGEQLPREFRRVISADLHAIALKLDESIGRNSTNALTRSSLREIRSAVDQLTEKIEKMGKSSLSLTRRELEILDALSSGQSAASIADELSISEPTVKSHISAIYRKLEVKNKVQALAQAKDRGLLTKKY